MRHADSSPRGILPLILLLLLAFGLIVLSQALLRGTLDFPTPREAAVLPTQPEETATELPVQEAEASPTSTPTTEPTTTPQIPIIGERTPAITHTSTLPPPPPTFTSTSPPLETPLPSSTPYPTPTEEAGFTRTPFPLITPEVNPAGTIVYVMRMENGSYMLNTLSMDAFGEVVGSSSLTLDLSPEDLGGTLYPSPDGNHLAWIYPAEVGLAGYIIDVNTGDIEQKLANLAAFFGWHPDNRHVLVERSPTSGLWLDDLGSERDTPLDVRGSGKILSAAISPDGRRVIYTIQKDSSSAGEVWMVGDDGRNARYLDWLNGGIFFSWAPDGNRILTNMDDGWALLNGQGSNPRQIAAFTSFAQCYPTVPQWSPNGSSLTIVTDQGGQPLCQGWSEAVFQGTNINLVDAQMGVARELASGGTGGYIDPTWSPDGSMLAFVSNRSGNAEIWIAGADGSNLRLLTNAGQYVRFPFWRRP